MLFVGGAQASALLSLHSSLVVVPDSFLVPHDLSVHHVGWSNGHGLTVGGEGTARVGMVMVLVAW